MLDYLGIFNVFNEKKIKYMVVGGLAVNFYGIPRMTYDIDLLLYLEDKNLKAFLFLMKKWGFKPKIPVNIEDFADAHKRTDWIKHKNIKAFNFVNTNWAISEIDVVINTPVDYKKAEENIQYINLHDVVVPTISINNLIEMKKKSNRIQDKEDIKNLRKILRQRNK